MQQKQSQQYDIQIYIYYLLTIFLYLNTDTPVPTQRPTWDPDEAPCPWSALPWYLGERRKKGNREQKQNSNWKNTHAQGQQKHNKNWDADASQGETAAAEKQLWTEKRRGTNYIRKTLTARGEKNIGKMAWWQHVKTRAKTGEPLRNHVVQIIGKNGSVTAWQNTPGEELRKHLKRGENEPQ